MDDLGLRVKVHLHFLAHVENGTVSAATKKHPQFVRILVMIQHVIIYVNPTKPI